MDKKISFTQAELERLFPGLRIERPRREDLDAAQAHLDNLTKPRGSLGRLEELARRLYAMRRGELPLSVSPALMLTVAGDHGVAAQGVSPFPQAVTRQMVMNFLHGGAAVNVLCRCGGLDLRVVDAGCAGGPFTPHPMLLDRRLGDGTADMSRGPAMSRETCLNGLRRGVDLAAEAAGRGYRCLGTGEMGIANSTAGTALYCALLGLDPDALTGPGAGSDPAMVRHKAGIVREALRVNASLLASGDPVDILAAVGGFEIAVMSGIMLGAAAQRLPVLVDGFICSAAYAAALAICPALADYAVLSHASAEPGHSPALSRLAHDGAAPDGGGEPLLHLGMRLGEGTGGALAYHLLRGAAAIYNDMATFDAAGVTATEADRTA
ncbi:nicotinate-nucleotide--dimethylbenzimidazole phosphoribosyltransferase [Desulfovibrio sp. PG-178-WT-4]|uniref:Nicotinate-nucleotide--dimethylbenzimidazole phosphoribosyltransferase n=1 Tax=Desulfovibrio porci TaxID=2605782 RepID=A0A6L5XJW1_9BACT|nr:nicotinate-nucleotide--dimethylbenzimidazole phosphoribosyltransferase [Desulfovibrio porci]MDY3809822.1 nicotinate-nucleotide--dimethylbenzimidazole phosphoribosyltransferase [Desulfovibrio porci]MSS27475.1 nicotinate-nucleotide--dimethylbenzimidazole phosphoribosyltransferase [Desulfovibrio porci]